MILKVNIEKIKYLNKYDEYENRYIIVEKDTRRIIDNAQGYGYKSEEKARNGYLAKRNYSQKGKRLDKSTNICKSLEKIEDDIFYEQFRDIKENENRDISEILEDIQEKYQLIDKDVQNIKSEIM